MSIIAVGDAMCHISQLKANRTKKGYSFLASFTPLRSLISGADFAMGNLETTLSRKGNYSGYPMFRTPVAYADALRGVGFDALTTANNHSCDGGKYGVDFTASYLNKIGLAHTGTAKAPAMVTTHDGITVGVISYTFGTNGNRQPYAGAVNIINEKRIISAMKALHTKVDFVILVLNWGNEYKRTPEAATRAMAHRFVNAGADMIVASHPHVVRPVEVYRGHYIAYSLGNFISSQTQPYTNLEISVAFELRKPPNGKVEVSKFSVVPLYRDHSAGHGTSSYRVVALDFADSLLSKSDRAQMATYRKYCRKVYGSLYAGKFSW
jgi:poly-gamma-glutamate synthesis protein (capsule biosynthesis protein)